ncbi:galactose mutarotase [Nesterenkonia sp. HG001]|uniref:aldose epimerase family protein n=1 Tax=Nesterenkonia sp. HG001 TaxID=2983207 RepID=UPI002AC7351A|nr:galactose mutarotase [Nesterenkonia sp. HG001]MDZ5078231.1 galactose mutarotase [Nesterenkonia sp. HG001]
MDESRSSVTITGGGYVAEIGLRGGQLLSLRHEQDELVVPAAQAEGSYAGAVLAPWPNRIAGATYVHDETLYELPDPEEGTGAALHGLLRHADFEIVRQDDSEVELTTLLEASEGYPFALEFVLFYRVSSDIGLAATLMARQPEETTTEEGVDAFQAANAAPAPYGVGFHPYLRAGSAPLDECRLRLPARTVATTEATGKVTGRKSVSGDLDLSNGPLLVGRTIDHAYTDLPEEGWTAELVHGPSGFVVRMIADTPWVQVYTGEQLDRAGVAVEPMTCPPDAFNSGEDVIYLAPGQWHRVGYSIEVRHRD